MTAPAEEVARPVLGSTMPRLWTPPLVTGEPGPCGCGCPLDETNSYGFQVVDFARDVIGTPLDPWERWLVIHGGELLADGRPRFRTLLVLVARQNGKTTLLRVLTLWWLFVDLVEEAYDAADPVTVLGTSSKLDYARESWEGAVRIAQRHLTEEIPRNGIRRSNGEQMLSTAHNTRYKIAAANDDAGRSLTIARLVLDELRQHHDWTCWNAAKPTTNAVPDAQIWGISNQGSDASVVLDSLREAGIRFIETGEGDPRHGLFEWSSPDGADPTDLAALAQANPNLGRRIDVDALFGEAMRAKAAGGDELAGFRTEIMCQRVHLLDPAIDPDAWDAAGVEGEADFSPYRGRVALCVDVALDGTHASLVAAAVRDDGKVYTGVVEAWSGRGCTAQLRAQLPKIVERVRPRAIGWFPNGPAAAVTAELKERKGWPPRRVACEEIRGEVAAVCMGLNEQVIAGQIVHQKDPLLDSHVGAAQKLYQGNQGAWVFVRKGSSAIDGAYALAGAVHLARTLPPAPPPLTAL